MQHKSMKIYLQSRNTDNAGLEYMNIHTNLGLLAR
jgi:hypothetical protein